MKNKSESLTIQSVNRVFYTFTYDYNIQISNSLVTQYIFNIYVF